MTRLYGTLAGLAVVALLLLGVEQYGEHRVQVEWDKDKAVRQALLDEEKRRGAQTIVDMREQFNKEKKYAESEAGKRAVAKWLRDNGLLPSGLPVRPASLGQAGVPEGADGTACESGAAERIAEFAARCIDDARKVEMCAEWAVRAGLPVE